MATWVVEMTAPADNSTSQLQIGEVIRILEVVPFFSLKAIIFCPVKLLLTAAMRNREHFLALS
jgi:hypothetical protein